MSRRLEKLIEQKAWETLTDYGYNDAHLLEQLTDATGHCNQRARMVRAALDQQHRDRRVGRQAIGEDTTRRARADNDVVVDVAHCCSPGSLTDRGKHKATGMNPQRTESGICSVKVFLLTLYRELF